MSTLDSTVQRRSGLKVAVRAAAVAIGALVALAAALLILTLSGTGQTRVVRAAQPATPPQPLIQYRGTGQPPATAPSIPEASRQTGNAGHGLVP